MIIIGSVVLLIAGAYLAWLVLTKNKKTVSIVESVVQSAENAVEKK